MEKKNIVIFTNTLLSGGAEKQALLLAVNLSSDHNVYLVVYYGEKVEDKFRTVINDKKLNVIYLSGGHLKKAFSFYSLLKKHHINLIFSYLLTTNLIGSLIGKFANVPVRAGGIRNAKLDKNKLPVQRFINNYLSSHTIFNNYDGITALEKQGFDISNAVVIPNCFELDTEVQDRPASPVVKIITVGRFVNQKGYADALEIMKKLKDDDQRYKYYIIGFGELEDTIRGQIMSLNLSNEVEMIINPPNMADYYMESDIYLCTSYFEGLSNTVMEALSFSLPVVATDVGDNNRLVENGVNGFLVTAGVVDSFMKPLKSLLTSAELRNKMGREGYRLIREVYSGSAFKNNYEHFITSVTK